MPRQDSRSRFVRNCVLMVLLAFAAALLIGSSGVIEAPGNPKNGRNLFVSKGCIRCHSIWDSSGKRGPNLASVGMGRNLYELCASIWSHWSQMNAMLEKDKELRISLTASEFNDIISYLYYLNYKCEPGQTDLGSRVFSRKGCIECHDISPLPGKSKPGRPVYEMRQFQDAVAMAVAVWNHGPNMYKSMAGKQIPWPQFEPKEVADLVEFIRSQTAAPSQSTMIVPGDPLAGRALFASRSCATCHTSGSRNSSNAPDLASSEGAKSLSSLIASLWNHFPKMSQKMAANGVGYKKITEEEMENILAYVYWLRAYGLTGNPEAGRNLYSKKCASCHSSSQQKPAAAPRLIRSETTGSAYGLMAAIWNHGPRMDSVLRERKLPWPALTGEEMRDLVVFFRKGNPDGSETKP